LKKLFINLCLLLTAVYGLASQAENFNTFPTVDIKVKDIALHVEYANTYELRAQGLMNRKQLCGDCGMLFKFDSSKRAAMWMMDTFVALDVAFIRSDGLITDIRAMQPQDLTSIQASEDVLYALEMNQGWFQSQGIMVGDKIAIP
jgi:uncharacterized membrane protein (UPF0127 family)